MKDYDVLVPMSRLKELEEIENKFNNDEHKIVNQTILENNFSVNVYTKDGFVYLVEPDTTKKQIFYNSELELGSVRYDNLRFEIKMIFNNQSHNLYKCLKIELEQRLKNEVEQELKDLPFLQKLKLLFKQ